MSNNKITGKLVKILFFFIIFFSLLTTTASGKIVVVDEDLSYAIDHNTGDKFSYKDFRGMEVVEGHELEFVVILKLLKTAPNNCALGSRTTLSNPKWEFEGEIYQAAEAQLDISNRHAGSVLRLELSCWAPKSEVEVEELAFHYLHKGIGKKEVFVENDLYEFQNEEPSLIEPIDKLLFFSVHPDYNRVLKQIEEDLNSSAVKYENPEYLEVIMRLAKNGHPGWAKEISEDFRKLEPIPPPPPDHWVVFVLLLLLLIGIPASIFISIALYKRRYRNLPEKLEKAESDLESMNNDLTQMREKLIYINAPDEIKNKANEQILKVKDVKNKVTDVRRELE